MATVEETEQLAVAWAHKHPRKSALALVRLPRQIEEARERGHDAEAVRLTAIQAGYEAVVGTADTLCKRCGKPLTDETQPGYSEQLGPECYRIVSSEG